MNDDVGGGQVSGESGTSQPEQAMAAAPAPVAARPAWTYALMPAAVLAGLALVAAAIWVAFGRDDGGNGSSGGSHDAAAQAPVSSAGDAGVSSAANSATSILTALRGYAKQVGLDSTQFEACLRKDANITLINNQLQRGVSFGVEGTPTFVINNKRIVGAQPPAVFEEVIAAELKGSPATLDGYSAAIKELATTNPPRFSILDKKPDISDAQVEGNPQAKVIVAEFSDFQCPFCKRWTDDYMAKLREKTKTGDVAIAFLHFPITQIHPNAGNAAVAAACAAEQGKFWQMHDLLFARQAEWQNLKP